jgi:hypothetical protein
VVGEREERSRVVKGSREEPGESHSLAWIPKHQSTKSEWPEGLTGEGQK